VILDMAVELFWVNKTTIMAALPTTLLVDLEERSAAPSSTKTTALDLTVQTSTTQLVMVALVTLDMVEELFWVNKTTMLEALPTTLLVDMEERGAVPSLTKTTTLDLSVQTSTTQLVMVALAMLDMAVELFWANKTTMLEALPTTLLVDLEEGSAVPSLTKTINLDQSALTSTMLNMSLKLFVANKISMQVALATIWLDLDAELSKANRITMLEVLAIILLEDMVDLLMANRIIITEMLVIITLLGLEKRNRQQKIFSLLF